MKAPNPHLECLASPRGLPAGIRVRAARRRADAYLCAVALVVAATSAGCDRNRGELSGDVRAVAERSLGAHERKPFSSFQTVPWTDFTPGEKGALEALGFDERSWGLKILPESTRRPFDELTRQQQEAVRAYLPLPLEQQWAWYWPQVQGVSPPPDPSAHAPAGAVDITREQALEVYEEFVSACKRKDARKLWDLLVDQIRDGSERRAEFLRNERPKIVRGALGYRRPLDTFSGFEYHRAESFGLDSDPGRDYALCREVERWTEEVMGPQGREYLVIVTRPREPPMPGALPFWAMGLFLRREESGKVRVRATEWDDMYRPRGLASWTTARVPRGEVVRFP